MSASLYIILCFLSMIWGTSFLLIKILLADFGPWSITCLRCLCGALVLLAIILFSKQKNAIARLPWFKLFVVGICNSAIPWALIAFSETRISSSLTAVLNTTTPIWTILLGILFFKASANPYQWIGLIAGFAGVLCLINVDWSTFKIDDPIGFGAMLFATFCYGWASQMTKHHFQHISVYVISFATLAGGALISGIAAMFSESVAWEALLLPDNAFSILFLGILGSGIAYILFYYLLQKGGPEFATLVTYVVPPFAIMWGYFLLDEQISVTLYIGLLLILSGVFISGKKTSKKRAASLTQHLE